MHQHHIRDKKEYGTHRNAGPARGARKERKVLLIVCIICLAIAVICLGIYAYAQWQRARAAAALEALRETAVTTTVEDTDEEDVLEDIYDPDIYEATSLRVERRTIDWAALAEENEDIYAWIYVPETNIDYPVLQDPTDDTYYLNYNIDGSKGYPGCIYSEATYNNTSFSDLVTVLYGHNMKNKTMFATLHSFEDETFFDANRYVYIYMPTGHTLVYEICSATAHSNEHIFYANDLTTIDGVQTFVDGILSGTGSNDHFDEDAITRLQESISGADTPHILILSTCIANQSDKRWIVMSSLLNPEDL